MAFFRAAEADLGREKKAAVGRWLGRAKLVQNYRGEAVSGLTAQRQGFCKLLQFLLSFYAHCGTEVGGVRK